MRAGVEFAHLGDLMKQVDTVQVVVGDDPFLAFADSLLYQVAHLRQRPGLQRQTQKSNRIGVICVLVP